MREHERMRGPLNLISQDQKTAKDQFEKRVAVYAGYVVRGTNKTARGAEIILAKSAIYEK